MVLRMLGAVLVLTAAGGFSFSLARDFRKEEAALTELISGIDYISAEISCRLTPLPQVFGQAALQIKGPVGKTFAKLGEVLQSQIYEDAGCCMEQAMQQVDALPELVRTHLIHLGMNLGSFDLQEQLAGFASIRHSCQRDLMGLQSKKDANLRNYQTLGLCAGAALVILLL